MQKFVDKMQYSVVHLVYSFAEEWEQDLLEQTLCDMGFEVFDGSDAYIQTDVLEANRADIEALIAETDGVAIEGIEACEDKNWNASWEAEHEIVELPMDVRITPHCAFGAGHHETTSMMIDALVEAKEKGYFDLERHVLDMGCGTAILAILAAKMKAAKVYGIDIDAVAAISAYDNARANRVGKIVETYCGDASLLQRNTYDVLLANINRNILLQDMPTYAHSLHKDGMLFVSGFYVEDMPMLIGMAANCGLDYVSHDSIDNWCCIKFCKNQK